MPQCPDALDLGSDYITWPEPLLRIPAGADTRRRSSSNDVARFQCDAPTDVGDEFIDLKKHIGRVAVLFFDAVDG